MSGIEREPCPWRIVDDAGGAYGFGNFLLAFILSKILHHILIIFILYYQ